ncbi:zinc finger protein, putative [Plasmodium sp. gorilla clade G3]|nr:zinc finger protein, putative [Plasmodium sp. gorilla clade G3]
MVYATLLSEEDLSRFRTKQCKRLLNGGCNFGLDRCQYSHNEFWNRRCPFYLSDSSFIRYITVMCPDVETRGDGSINSLCLRGGECPFAHSTEEILYHPLFYKTKRCEDYKKGSCNTYYCPFIHGLAETRVPGTYKLPFTNGIDIPNIPNVIIVDKIDICSKNNNGIINDKYMKNMSFKKKSDIQLGHVNTNDIHCNNKTNSMNSALYDSMDTISNKNDMNKNAVDRSNLSFNNAVFNKDSFFNFSEENIKMNMLNKNGAFEHINNNTYSRNSMKDSINSFGSFEANNMTNNNISNSQGNLSSVVGNMTNGNVNGINGMSGNNNPNNNNSNNNSNNSSSNNNDNNGNDDSIENNNNNNIKDKDNENKDNNKMNKQSKCTNIKSCNYNEFLPSKLSGTVSGSYQNMCSKNISLSTNNSTSYIDTISTPNKNYNKNLNILKLKQNHSSCSTDAHEINFNEHEATSDDAIEDEEDEYFNSENNESSVSNRNNELERINCDTKLSNITVETNLNVDRNNEINLLEVIKCLKGLCEKIMKGDLTFTSEQWDNIAQITYEIVAVIEFNRVMKMKKTANKIRNDIYNKNKDFIFHMENKEYKKERNDTKMEKELYINEKDKIEEKISSNIDNLVEEQNSNINGIPLDVKLKNYDEIFERPQNEKVNDINTLKYSLNENIYMDKDKNNSFNKENSILFLEKDEKNNMLNKFNFNFNKSEEHILNNLNELIHTEDNELIHFYQEQLGDNFLDENNELDIISMKQKFIPSQINKTNIINDNNDNHALQNLKDSCFLEYYNINKSNNLTFKDKNDNNEKLSSQQPFVSFFSFLSE